MEEPVFGFSAPNWSQSIGEFKVVEPLADPISADYLPRYYIDLICYSNNLQGTEYGGKGATSSSLNVSNRQEIKFPSHTALGVQGGDSRLQNCQGDFCRSRINKGRDGCS